MSSNSKTRFHGWLTLASVMLAAPAMLAQDVQLARDASPSRTITKHFDFSKGTGGVLSTFTDYDLYTADLQFKADIRELPKEVNVFSRNRRAFFLSSNNRPDDILMLLKAPLTAEDGVEEGRKYKLSLQFQVASNSTDCFGSGGRQANVFLKAGGAAVEPVPTLLGSYVSINVDKGQQTEGGTDLGVIGDIWNGQECVTDPKDQKWVMLKRSYDHPTPIKTNHEQLWIAVGAESGYEAVTGLYFYSIDVTLSPVD